MKQCPYCGGELDDQDIFCQYCGNKVTSEAQSQTQSNPNGMQSPPPRICSSCQKQLEEGEVYCPRCGTKVGEGSRPAGNNMGTAPYSRENNMGKYLKYYSVIVAIFFGYIACTYLPYLTYLDEDMKTNGLVMVLICVWITVTYFLVAFCCKKQCAKHLLCSLIFGVIAKIVVKLVLLQTPTTDSVAMVINVLSILSIFGCYFLMDASDMIDKMERKSVVQIVKETPGVIVNIISRNETRAFYPNYLNPMENEVKKLLAGNLFLALCLLYTINLFSEVVLNFTWYGLVLSVFSILTCVSMWLLYSKSKQNMFHTTGINILLVVNYIKLVAAIVVCVILDIIFVPAILGTSSDEDVGYALLTILIIFLIEALWIGYIWLITRIFSDGKQFALRQRGNIRVSLYPVVIIGISVFGKVVVFLIKAYIDSISNQVIGSINQFGEDTSSSIGSLFDMFGLGDEAYGASSSLYGNLTGPITGWIGETFGFSQNPIFMLTVIAFAVLEMIFFITLKNTMKKRV